MLKQIESLSAFIGNTPLYPINKVFQKNGVQVYAKLEWQQFSGSVKARAAFNILKSAILEGHINSQRGIIDASSGNTAVAYATIGAALGIPVTLCVPENASEQKKIALEAVGANVIYTSKYGTTDESQEKALSLFNEHPDKYYYTDQYNNPNNWKAHFNGTANEIWNQTQGNITHFVAGLGTTGTFIGTSRKLKELNSSIRTISLQPETALHGLEGWKHLESAKVPGIYDMQVADNNYFIETFEVYEFMKEVAKKEGLLLSPSSSANLLGAIQVAKKIEKGVVVTVFPDHGSNYQEVLSEIFK